MFPSSGGSSCTISLVNWRCKGRKRGGRMGDNGTFAALKPSFPSSSACFSYPIGASSLYGPVFEVNFTAGSASRTGSVVVSVADGAIVRLFFTQELFLWNFEIGDVIWYFGTWINGCSMAGLGIYIPSITSSCVLYSVRRHDRSQLGDLIGSCCVLRWLLEGSGMAPSSPL